jgi:surfeit locus 1 family protein
VSANRTLLLGWGLALACMATFSALGGWQLSRMHEKRASLEAANRALQVRDAVALSAAADPARARDYDWAAGDGRFADAPAVLLDNQQRQGRVGVRAYRLFDYDGGGALLVELGWLPLDGKRTLPQVPRPVGPQHLEGLLASPPSHGIGAVSVEALPGGALLTTGLDASALAAPLRRADLPQRVLRLDPTLRLGYARDLDILPNTLPPERHLGYAVQWFALAAAALLTALVLTLRKKARPRP